MLSFFSLELLPSHSLATKSEYVKALIPTNAAHRSVKKQNMSTSGKREKKNTFISENNLESIRVFEFTRRKDFGIHQRENRQKFKFLLISIILKNIYRISDLFTRKYILK